MDITGVPKLTMPMSYSSKKNRERNGYVTKDNREHIENGSMKKRIHTLRRPSINGSVL